MRALWFVLILAAGCAEPPTVPNPPDLLPAGHQYVSGHVWNYGAAGVAPASSGSVFGWSELAGSNRTMKEAAIGTDGRYRFAAPVNATVYVTGASVFHQPCSSRGTVAGEVTLDLHNVIDSSLLGANLPAALLSQAPTLSGIVYRETASGRLPLSGAVVQLNTAKGIGPIIARTLTDAQGRYILCAVNATSDLAIVASLRDHHVSTPSRDLTGLTTLDIELRPFEFANGR